MNNATPTSGTEKVCTATKPAPPRPPSRCQRASSPDRRAAGIRRIPARIVGTITSSPHSSSSPTPKEIVAASTLLSSRVASSPLIRACTEVSEPTTRAITA